MKEVSLQARVAELEERLLGQAGVALCIATSIAERNPKLGALILSRLSASVSECRKMNHKSGVISELEQFLRAYAKGAGIRPKASATQRGAARDRK